MLVCKRNLETRCHFYLTVAEVLSQILHMSCLPDDLFIPGFSWGCTFCWWEGSNSRTNWLCVVCAVCGFMLRVKVTRCQSGLVRLLIISPVKNQVLSVTMWYFYLTCGRQVTYVSFLTASFQSLLSSSLHLVEHCLSSTAWLWSQWTCSCLSASNFLHVTETCRKYYQAGRVGF